MSGPRPPPGPRSLERTPGEDTKHDPTRDNLAEAAHSTLHDRVEQHYLKSHIAHTDTQGMMRHTLDCLGALRITAANDDSLSPALKRVFRSACLVFLDHIARDQDDSYDDLSAAGHIMNSFPDETKKKDGRSWLPLHWAAMTESDTADIDTLARERPLAARTFHTSAAASASSDVSHAKGEHNLLPLHLLCSSRHPSLSTLTTVLGLHPDALYMHDRNGYLPLHWAARNCINVDVIDHLLTLYLDSVTEVTSLGQLPFLLSMANRRPAVSERLLECNSDALDSIDSDGNTALHYAAVYNNPEAAKMIIALRPSFILIKNFAGELPVHKIFSQLFRARARARARSSPHYTNANTNSGSDGGGYGYSGGGYGGNNATSTNTSTNTNTRARANSSSYTNSYSNGSPGGEEARRRWRQLEILRIVLDEGPEAVSHRDKDGHLPLHLAITSGAAIEIVEAIYNVYPTAALLPDNQGNLPVHFAADPDIQRLLFGASAQMQHVGVSSSFAKFATITPTAEADTHTAAATHTWGTHTHSHSHSISGRIDRSDRSDSRNEGKSEGTEANDVQGRARGTSQQGQGQQGQSEGQWQGRK